MGLVVITSERKKYEYIMRPLSSTGAPKTCHLYTYTKEVRVVGRHENERCPGEALEQAMP